MTILCTTTHSKMSRDEQLFSLLDATKKTLATYELVDVSRVGDAFWGNVHHCMQELVLERGIRYNIEIEVPECMNYIPSLYPVAMLLLCAICSIINALYLIFCTDRKALRD